MEVLNETFIPKLVTLVLDFLPIDEVIGLTNNRSYFGQRLWKTHNTETELDKLTCKIAGGLEQRIYTPGTIIDYPSYLKVLIIWYELLIDMSNVYPVLYYDIQCRGWQPVCGNYDPKHVSLQYAIAKGYTACIEHIMRDPFFVASSVEIRACIRHKQLGLIKRLLHRDMVIDVNCLCDALTHGTPDLVSQLLLLNVNFEYPWNDRSHFNDYLLLAIRYMSVAVPWLLNDTRTSVVDHRYLFNARENMDVFRLLLTHPTIRANEEDIGCVFRSAVIEGYVTHLQLLLDYGINLSQFRRPDDIETALLFKRYAMAEFLHTHTS